ncbi:hypothetical protein Ae201684P_004398 [Aphanomyces euteiches]|uniref:Uncharacterized protein n=1 Tax=Aphanomyces euteiches TaxID=100861 RepID=A0A6G0XCM1_9STRA|nr:hypothetical protein Ae201684_006260 [Aphanomyces euteiches]KAH9068696.1 hypothetical protein Ae201684P_004398 [Aphanomyces euteiches]KAH9139871.1 hypothetical protein AeRB84_015847 [Aphanomyces euteiches]
MVGFMHSASSSLIDDDDMGVPAPVFEYVAAPVLNKWDQDELIKWRTKREQYEAKLLDRCMVTGEDLSAIQVSVKNSVDSTLLPNLAKYVFRKSPKEVSHEELIAEIDKKCGSLKNGYLPGVDALFTKMLEDEYGHLRHRTPQNE